MKLMKTQDAVGQVLCHDITQIIKGVTKDAVFRKGHVITEEDIPALEKTTFIFGKRERPDFTKMRRQKSFGKCVRENICIQLR